MSATLTIPADERLEVALRERAKANGKSISEVARDILHRALLESPESSEDRSLAHKAGHLKGKLRLPEGSREPWRAELRARNWRP